MASLGLYDDLVPADSKPAKPIAKPAASGLGLYDDLLPAGPAPAPQAAAPSPVQAQPGPVAAPVFSDSAAIDPMTGISPMGALAPTPAAPSEPGFIERYLKRGTNQAGQALDMAGVLSGVKEPREFARDVARANRTITPRDPATEQALNEISKADGLWDALVATIKRPRAAAAVTLESLPQAIAPITGGVVGGVAGSQVGPVGTVVGAAGGAGVASFSVEYINTILDEMRESKVDMNNEDAILGAFNNPELMARAKERGVKRGVPIAVFDALSAGLASRIYKPVARTIEAGTKSRTAGRVAGATAEVGTQAILGASGEAAAQITDKGAIVKPGDVVLEGAGELVMGPVESLAQAGINRATDTPAARVARAIDEDAATIRRASPQQARERFAQPSATAQGAAPAQTSLGLYDDLIPQGVPPVEPPQAPPAAAPAAPAAPAAAPGPDAMGRIEPTMGEPPVAAPQPQVPSAVMVFNGLIDAELGNAAAIPEDVRDFLTQNGLVEMRRGQMALSARGSELRTALNDPEMAASEAPALIQSFMRPAAAPVAPPVEPTMIDEPSALGTPDEVLAAAPQPAAQRAPAAAPRQVFTPKNTPFMVEPVVVELSELIAATGDLQPRDRSRAASQQQIRQIVQNFNPDFLMPTVKADNGPPIALNDGTVLSGNGRVAALRALYADPAQAAKLEAYRNKIAENLGVDVSGYQQPVLVMRLAENRSQPELVNLAQELNARDKLDMGAVENASQDASKLTPAIMALYKGGPLTAGQNAQFMQRFINDIVGLDNLGTLQTADGKLSAEGRKRIENAIMVRAYGDNPVLQSVLEDAETNIRSLAQVLLEVAPAWAKMRDAVAAGQIQDDLDFTGELVQAIQIIQSARDGGKPIAAYLEMDELLADSRISEEVLQLLATMHKRAETKKGVTYTQRAVPQLVKLLNRVVDEAYKYTGQEGLLGAEAARVPRLAVEKNAIERFIEDDVADDGEQQGALLDAQPQANNPRARRAANRPLDGRRIADRNSQADRAGRAADEDGRRRAVEQPARQAGQQPAAETQANRLRTDGRIEPILDDDGRASGQDDFPGLSKESKSDRAKKNAGQGRQANQRFRGTQRGSLLEQVSFTNRQSIFRNAFAELGLDPTQAELLPPQRQYEILRQGLKDTYGLAFVEKTDATNIREVIDQLLDAYRGMQLMAYVTELPSSAIGLEGTLGLVLRRNVEYLGAYYPAGGKIEGVNVPGSAISLPRRSNSFAHEWGHAFDYWLLGKYGNLMNSLSSMVRKGEALPQTMPNNVREAYALLIRSLFFDRALEAQEIMELERKIEIAKTDEQRKTLQAQLDKILSGASQARNSKSAYYKQQKQFVAAEGGDINYWREPTEMLARAFEAYISFKVEGAGGTTEFLGKGVEAYQSDAIPRLALTFPKDSDRFNIFRAFDLLFDEVRTESLLNPNAEAAAEMPNDVKLASPVEYFRDPIQSSQAPLYKRLFTNERDTIMKQLRQLRRESERPRENVTVGERATSLARGFAHTNRGVMLSMEQKYRKQGNKAAADAIWNLQKRVTTDPGSGRATIEGGTYAEAVERETNRFDKILGGIVQKFKLDEFEAGQQAALRDVLTAIDDEPMQYGGEITAPAAQLRILTNNIYDYMKKAGVDVGYVNQGYLSRILDEPVIMDKPAGFLADAGELYRLVFDREVASFEGGVTAEAIAGLNAKMRQVGVTKNDTQFQAYFKAVKQWRKLAKALAAAEQSEDADKIDAAQAALTEFVEENLDVFDQAYEDTKFLWATKAAEDWLQRILYGSPAGWESSSPSGNFLKRRTLPPEADKIMAKWYVQDPVEVVQTYMHGAVRKAEYNRRFGKPAESKGVTKWEQLQRDLQAAEVTPEDQEYLEKIVYQETGQLRGTMPRGMETALNTVQTVGTMALLGRVVLTSLAEPISVAFQTGKALDGWRALGSTLREIVPTKSIRERRALARALGIVGSPDVQEVLANRFGGTYRESKKMSRTTARYYVRVGLTGLTNAQRRSAMKIGIQYFVEMAETINDEKAKAQDKDAARRELVDFGVQPSEVQEFADWMMQYSDRMPDPDDIVDVNGELTQFGLILSTGIARLVNQSIQNPKAADRPFAANTTVGRMVYGLLSFNMAFWRNIMVKSYKKIMRETQAGGIGRGAYVAMKAVAFPAMSLYLGHFIVTAAREALLNPDKWDEEDKKGNLWPYLVGLTFSRAGFTGMIDPFYNALLSLKYQRDLSNLMIGPAVGFFMTNLQRLVSGWILPNSDENNNVETTQIKAAYELAAQPTLAYAVGALPGGPALGLAAGATAGYLTSPAFKAQFAEWFVGPKDGNKRKNESAGF